jgi:two-component system, OmpR family, sensor histidine kinase KdpD
MTVLSVQPSTLATVAHELRTPLTALQSTTEILDRDFEQLAPNEVRSMVSSMHRRVLWIRGLIENLLTTASLRDGRFQILRRPVDIRDVIADVRPMAEPLLGRKKQRLVVRGAPGLLVAGDERRLGQVLLNLLNNASKYSGIGTKIDVTVAMRRGQVRVTVADRGPGVAPELATRIFEPYDRGGRTEGEGVGIGLSVVRSIVEAHGGKAGVKNRRVGGAAFWFELAPIANLASSPRSGEQAN